MAKFSERQGNGGSLRENKMGVMPENKLLLTMGLPTMFSMIVGALYNIVDSIFVAQLGESALAAVSLAFPAQALIYAVSVGTGVGMNALLSRSLGQKDTRTATAAAANGFLLMVLSSVVFALLGGLFSRAYFNLQTGIAEIAEDGSAYLFIVTVFSLGVFIEFAFERMLMATGKTVYPMISQCVGVAANLILDPIMIFGLFGFPALGVKGAAIATVIAQGLSGLLAMAFHFKVNHEVRISFVNFKPSGAIVKRIYAIGTSQIVQQGSGYLMMFLMNQILLSFTAAAIAVYGAYTRLEMLFLTPVYAICGVIVPVVAYNYGAQKKERIIRFVKLAMSYVLAITTIGLLVLMLFPKQIITLFNASEDMLNIGIPALRIVGIAFPFSGVCVLAVALFQALGKGFIGLIQGVCGRLVFILLLAYLFSQAGLGMVWWAFPIAGILAFLLCVWFSKRVYAETIKGLQE
jgi:putative MATE family efflux protein